MTVASSVGYLAFECGGALVQPLHASEIERGRAEIAGQIGGDQPHRAALRGRTGVRVDPGHRIGRYARAKRDLVDPGRDGIGADRDRAGLTGVRSVTKRNRAIAVATLRLPIATAPVPGALLSAPIATAPVPVAKLGSPIATAPLPAAMLPAPIETARPSIACAPVPIATDWLPLAMLEEPTAIASAPVACGPAPLPLVRK